MEHCHVIPHWLNMSSTLAVQKILMGTSTSHPNTSTSTSLTSTSTRKMYLSTSTSTKYPISDHHITKSAEQLKSFILRLSYADDMQCIISTSSADIRLSSLMLRSAVEVVDLLQVPATFATSVHAVVTDDVTVSSHGTVPDTVPTDVTVLDVVPLKDVTLPAIVLLTLETLCEVMPSCCFL